MTEGLYRDPSLGLRQRRDELLAARLAERQALPAAALAVLPAAAARLAAGALGLAAALALILVAAFASGSRAVLLFAWPLIAAGALATRALARRRQARWLDQQLRPGADPAADLDRLAVPLVSQLARRAARRERLSFALPLVALALIAPLTLHALVSLGLGTLPRDFDAWTRFSLVLVGHAHLALAIGAWRFVRDLHRAPDEHLGLNQGEAVSALAVTTLVALVPGVLLLGLPPLLVLLTGAAFVPGSFALVRRRLYAERLAFALVTPASAR